MSTTYTGGSVEVDLPYGGDFSYDSTGDLILAIDAPGNPGNPVATNQRLVRLILSSPNLVGANGKPIGYADDIFHPNWGAGMRAYVSENFSPQTLQKLANNIRQQLAQDYAVAASPSPTVTLTMVTTTAATLQIVYYDTDGEKQTLPTINLTPSAATVVGG
jgi:hypothetical protein